MPNPPNWVQFEYGFDFGATDDSDDVVCGLWFVDQAQFRRCSTHVPNPPNWVQFEYGFDFAATADSDDALFNST